MNNSATPSKLPYRHNGHKRFILLCSSTIVAVNLTISLGAWMPALLGNHRASHAVIPHRYKTKPGTEILHD